MIRAPVNEELRRETFTIHNVFQDLKPSEESDEITFAVHIMPRCHVTISRDIASTLWCDHLMGIELTDPLPIGVVSNLRSSISTFTYLRNKTWLLVYYKTPSNSSASYTLNLDVWSALLRAILIICKLHVIRESLLRFFWCRHRLNEKNLNPVQLGKYWE